MSAGLTVAELIAYMRLDSVAFDRGLAASREGMGSATTSAQRLGGALGITERAFSNVGRMANGAAGGTAKFRAAQLSAVAATERYNAVLADENATIRQLASAEAALIRANEAVRASTPTAAIARTGAVAEETTTRMAGLRSSMSSGVVMAKQLGVAFGAFALARKAIDITHQAADFNASMVRIQTQAGATAAEIRGFSGDVLGLTKTGQAPDDLATSLYHVYSATKALGYTGPQMLDAVTTAAEGATVSGADLEETTNALTATMVSGLGSVNDMGKAMGALNAIVGAGDMKLSDLNDALGTGILAAVKVYGVSLDQAGAALAVFGDNNIRGADGATKLRMSIQDLSKPAAHADEVLGSIGLTTTSLRDDLEQGGLSLALHHLKDNLEAAGVTGDHVGGFLQDAFTKKAGVGLAILLNNLDQYDEKQQQIRDGAGGFGAAWKATTETAAFQFKRLGAEAEADGIILAQKVAPVMGRLASLLAGGLTGGLKIGSDALHPFVEGWHELAGILGPVAHELGNLVGDLGPVLPVVKFLASDVLTLWAAFKGYQIARYAMNAISDGIAAVQARSAAGLASARAYGAGWQATLAGNATEAQLTTRIMQAEFAQVAASATEEAAVVAKAKAREAAAYADTVAASKTATDAQVLAAEESSAAAQAAATVAVAAAEETAAAATTAATAVTESGNVAALGWSKMLGPLAIIGTGIALLTGLFGDNSDAAQEDAQNIDSLTSALQQDGGAVRQTTKDWIAHKLVTDGVLDALPALGLSYQTVTAAALGNKQALAQVNAVYQHGKDNLLNGGAAAALYAKKILDLARSLSGAKQRSREMDAAQVATNQAQRDGAQAASRNADALGNLAAGSHAASAGAKTNAGATADETEKIKDAEAANKKYTQSLHAELAAIESVIQARLGEAQSQDQFLEGLRAMDKQLNSNNGSISQNTAHGLANRDALLTQVGAALSLKDAQDAAGGSVAAHTRKLASNIAEIRAHAIAAGADKGELDKLLKSVNAFPPDIRSKVTLDTGPAQSTLVQLMNQINNLHPSIAIGVHYGVGGGHTLADGRASGGGAPEGWFSVGERGPELVHKARENVRIYSNAQSKSILAKTGMRAPGFAEGTGGPITTTQSGGKEVWVYHGQQYSSRAKAQQALDQDRSGPAQSALSGIQVSILAPSPSALKQFLTAADAASRKISAAAAAGVSPKKLAQLRGNLHDLVQEANKQLANLRVHINQQDLTDFRKSLGGTAADVASAYRALISDVRDAGGSKALIAHMNGLEQQLHSDVSARDRLRAQLGSRAPQPTAYDTLQTALENRRSEVAAVTSATTGFFNVASAGTDPNGGPGVTFGAMRAQQIQAKNTILKWTAGIKKLSKIFKSKAGQRYLQQLAEAGPQTYPQVEALLGAGAHNLHEFAATEAAIDKAAASVGGVVGTALDGTAVNEARADVRELRKSIENENKHIKDLDKRISDGIRAGLKGLKIEIDSRGIARLAHTGAAQNGRRS